MFGLPSVELVVDADTSLMHPLCLLILFFASLSRCSDGRHHSDADRYHVSPDGRGTLCTVQTPCDLPTAVELFNMTHLGPGASVEFVLLRGNYSVDKWAMPVKFHVGPGVSVTVRSSNPTVPADRPVLNWYEHIPVNSALLFILPSQTEEKGLLTIQGLTLRASSKGGGKSPSFLAFCCDSTCHSKDVGCGDVTVDNLLFSEGDDFVDAWFSNAYSLRVLNSHISTKLLTDYSSSLFVKNSVFLGRLAPPSGMYVVEAPGIINDEPGEARRKLATFVGCEFTYFGLSVDTELVVVDTSFREGFSIGLYVTSEDYDPRQQFNFTTSNFQCDSSRGMRCPVVVDGSHVDPQVSASAHFASCTFQDTPLEVQGKSEGIGVKFQDCTFVKSGSVEGPGVLLAFDPRSRPAGGQSFSVAYDNCRYQSLGSDGQLTNS